MAELATVNPLAIGLGCIAVLLLIFLLFFYPALVLSSREAEKERQRELYYLERNHGDKAAAWNEYVNDLLDGLEDDINDSNDA